MDNILFKRAKETLLIESQAVKDQIHNLDAAFFSAVRMIAGCPGRIVIMGIGKSGLIGRKIAATMSSLGLPSVFSHPAECLHGDLGMLMAHDIVVALSYTGESDEIKKVLPSIKNMNIPIVVITGRPSAAAWRYADCIINCRINKEACPYNLAPTASTTAMLALGDALALSASEKKGFRKEHFASFHPGGGLGKRLTVKVKDIMRQGKNNPVVKEDDLVSDALLIMTKTRLGATNVINKAGKFAGFFTDGDLRRKLQKDKLLLTRRIKDVMTKNPLTILPETMAADAAEILREHSFDNIPVVDTNNKPVGVLDERDLLSEGIV